MVPDRDQDSRRAATMYYLQDLTMDVIGRQLHTSRSTVSRMIKMSRESGLVEITVRPAATRAPGLSEALAERFDVEAYVVPVPDSAREHERLQQVAITAARLVTTWFGSDMVLGLAWGNTLAAVGRHLPRKATRGSAVVQLNGAANPRTSGVEFAGDLISRFGTAFTATVHHFPVPAFFDYPETKAAMWRERSVRRVLEVQQRADIAVFSVGAVAGRTRSQVYSGDFLDEADLAVLRREGVVGDVCTVFLRQDGSYADIPLNARATGPTPHELRSVARRVCVVAGDNKVRPLLAGLRAGVVTDLVIDEITAWRLVAAMDALPGGDPRRGGAAVGRAGGPGRARPRARAAGSTVRRGSVPYDRG